MFSNPFTEDKKDEKEVVKYLNKTRDIARNCLATEQFKTYREEYENVEGKLVVVLLKVTAKYNSGGMTLNEYGAKMLVYMTELKSVRSLLAAIDGDAKKGGNDE